VAHRRLQLTTSTSEGKASHIVLVANDFLTVYEYLGENAGISEPMLAFVGEYHFYDQLHGVVVARRADAKKDRHARVGIRHTVASACFLCPDDRSLERQTRRRIQCRVGAYRVAGVGAVCSCATRTQSLRWSNSTSQCRRVSSPSEP
jgi:hypothetical protein